MCLALFEPILLHLCREQVCDAFVTRWCLDIKDISARVLTPECLKVRAEQLVLKPLAAAALPRAGAQCSLSQLAEPSSRRPGCAATYKPSEPRDAQRDAR